MSSFDEEQDDGNGVDGGNQCEGSPFANAGYNGLKTSQRPRGQEASHQVAHCLNGRCIVRIEVY